MIAEQFVAGLLIAVSLKKEKESLEMSSFVEDQWNQFCSNLEQTAKFLAGDDQQLLDKFLKSANEFRGSKSPESYAELLPSIAEGTELAVKWQDR